MNAPRRDTRLVQLVKKLRVMVHSDNLWDLPELDQEMAALGIEVTDEDLRTCPRLQELARLMGLPHEPEGYTLVQIEKALQKKVYG